MDDPKPVAFEIREKRIPDSSLEFTGIVRVSLFNNHELSFEYIPIINPAS